MLARRNNDFDNFINPLSAPSPRHLASPLAPAERPHSPNRMAPARRPMISPCRSPRSKPTSAKIVRGRGEPDCPPERTCSNDNHPHKKAEYFIHIEDEDMYYCGVCATQAASQGFTVNRLAPVRRSRALPSRPEYAGHPRYQQVLDLLRNISSLEGEYRRLEPRRIAQHYQEQEALVGGCYDQLEGLLVRMREDHLADLRAESQRNCQLASQAQEALRTGADELTEAWEDIEGNIHDIIESVDAPSYDTCMRQYHLNIEQFRHRLSDAYRPLQHLTAYQHPALADKVQAFEQALQAIWTAPVPPKPTQVVAERNRSVRRVHEMLPRESEPEGQGAFRNLFPDDEDERLPEASPQFKAF